MSVVNIRAPLLPPARLPGPSGRANARAIPRVPPATPRGRQRLAGAGARHKAGCVRERLTAPSSTSPRGPRASLPPLARHLSAARAAAAAAVPRPLPSRRGRIRERRLARPDAGSGAQHVQCSEGASTRTSPVFTTRPREPARAPGRDQKRKRKRRGKFAAQCPRAAGGIPNIEGHEPAGHKTRPAPWRARRAPAPLRSARSQVLEGPGCAAAPALGQAPESRVPIGGYW